MEEAGEEARGLMLTIRLQTSFMLFCVPNGGCVVALEIEFLEQQVYAP